ncbi:MAG: LLM class F420-dependent oxidoreductase [Acidobacteria bacterium]|nr:LLM class F420-dependent oxidoreductase [Acidobacteriota bacterium]
MTDVAPARYGMTVPFDGQPLTTLGESLRELEALGYTDVWSSEVGGTDAFTPLAVAAVVAPSLRLGTAIVPAFTRGPALIAQSAATLAALAPGRFVLGVGSSSDVIVERWNGAPFERPLTRTRDVVRFVRQAMTGNKVTATFDTFAVDGFRLELVPDQPPPILVAALREGMLRLAGSEADGVILNWLAADDVPQAAAVVHGAAGGNEREVAARIFVCPSEDREAVLTFGKRQIAAYLNVPVYAAFHRWLGREEQLAGMWDNWQKGDRKAALAAIPDSLVDELIVNGPADACREQIQRYVANGVTTPVIKILGAGLEGIEAARVLAPR